MNYLSFSVISYTVFLLPVLIDCILYEQLFWDQFGTDCIHLPGVLIQETEADCPLGNYSIFWPP